MEERGNGELKLAGVRAGGGGVLEVWGGGLARERGNRDAWVPLVLKRTREGEPGLFPELATVAARWRPQSMTGISWRGKGGSSAVGVGPGVAGVPRVAVEQQEVVCGPPRQRAVPLAPAAEEAERERGGR